ncbi:uncharacterized protein RJT21DRAFT_44666 [Scheffersomyces amazonensis]|uniref:uncharacterized protein n=1 Tax=Scheffersomyces amazonensis TaxID=1078765 RepID=UPI00315D9F9F
MLTTESHLEQKHFQPIQTSLGSLKVSVAYRNHYEFDLIDNEEVLSSAFLTMDSGHGPRAKFDIDHIDHIDHNTGEQEQQEDEDREPEEQEEQEETKINKRLSISSAVSMSVSPCSSANREMLRENSPGTKKQQRPSIQPFKVGSIGNSPPPIGSGGSSLERKVSITSNKSTSNASLAATLRNPRSSTSLSHTATIPISTATNSNAAGIGGVTVGSIPRSISSSHGSTLPHDDTGFTDINSNSNSNTPRFSSSFGSRASRRFSNTSIKQSTPMANSNTGGGGGGGTSTTISHDILGTSAGSTNSTGGAPLSGLYMDDDINDFVRMIDSTTDLRFSSSSYNATNSGVGVGILGAIGSGSGQSANASDTLSRFQSLRSQHQQLGESVHASLNLHSATASGIGIGMGGGVSGSRGSSRKSSHSMASPPASIPSISSRLKERSPSTGTPSGTGTGSGAGTGTGTGAETSYSGSPMLVPPPAPIANEIRRSLSPEKRSDSGNSTFLKSSSSATPVVSRATVHANTNLHQETDSVRGMATTPSVYKKSIRYENVFDEDDDDEDNSESDNTKTEEVSKQEHEQHEQDQQKAHSTIQKQHEADDHHLHHHLHQHHHHHHHNSQPDDFEDDDLLFTMSDMNLTKN